MSRTLAKIRFIHQRLWMRDATYRVAFLAGPPPLIGIAIATLLWFAVPAGFRPFGGAARSDIPWAHYTPPVARPAASVTAVVPDAALPDADTNGATAGLTTGWMGPIVPITINAALDADVLSKPVGTFSTDQVAIELDQIIAAGPPHGLFVGIGEAFLAIRAAGTYGLSLRADRISDVAANCLIRLGFAHRRLVSNLRLDVSGSFTHTFDPTEFALQPGLYRVGVVFGCWKGDQAVGPGRLTLLIQRPGEAQPTPPHPSEILRPVTTPKPPR